MKAKNWRESLRGVRAFAFDVDGVFTNNRVLITRDGDLLRNANTRDGYALHEAVRRGYGVAVITGGRNEGVAKRYRDLGVQDIYLASKDKVASLEDYCQKRGYKASEVLFMGDDLPDYFVMQRVGVATCPSDAAPEIQALCHYISPFRGGEGCVRDVIEQVMRIHGKWEPTAGAGQ